MEPVTSTGRVERLRVVCEELSTAEEARILRACKDAKNLRSSTVVIIFRNGSFQTADVSKHHSRVA